MESLVIAFILALVAGWDRAPTRLVRALAQRMGRGAGLWLAATGAAWAAAFMSAASGEAFSALLAPRATGALVAGLLLGAAVLAWRKDTLAVPREPTRSFGAIALALALRCLGGPAALAVAAVALASGEGGWAALGGASGLSLTFLAGMRGSEAPIPGGRVVRRVVALVLGLTGAIIALSL